MRLVADPNIKIKRRRRKIYDEEFSEVLRYIWSVFDYPCSLRLKAMISFVLPKIENSIQISPRVREKLKKVSRATIDRVLKKYKKGQKLKVRPKAKTKPGVY